MVTEMNLIPAETEEKTYTFRVDIVKVGTMDYVLRVPFVVSYLNCGGACAGCILLFNFQAKEKKL